MYQMMGALCTVYGLFVLALVLIPNGLTGKLCFVFCGGSVLTVGLILRSLGRRQARRDLNLKVPSVNEADLSILPNVEQHL